MAGVDVVVPLYRPGRWIEGCLVSVAAQRDVDLRLILVDDDPVTPLATELAAAFGAGAIGLETDVNRGFAAAVNAGIAAGGAPLVCCLNQDARLADDYLARLERRFGADERLAAAAGKLLHIAGPDGTPDGLVDSAGLAFLRGRRAVDIGQGEPDDGRYDGWRDVLGVSGAAAVYRRRALQAVANGGRPFDEHFVMYKEDVDLAWRLRRAGWQAGVDGSAIGWHARTVTRAPGGDGPFRDLLALWRQERAKGAIARRLAWRNQMRMLVKNESTRSMPAALSWLVAAQFVAAAFDLALDPVGGIANRLRMLVEMPQLLSERDGRRGGPDLDRWLS